MRKPLKDMLTEYGAVAAVVYLVIFAVTLLGFVAAIRFGWRPQGVGGGIGVFAAAYVATKVAQPLRIVATVALTPIVAKLYERATGRVRSGAGT